MTSPLKWAHFMSIQAMIMSNFSSQAVNFQKSLSAYVDSRTGMFNSSLNIATILGNRMMGPGIELMLKYNPLSDDDTGFGKGYSLGLSYYDTVTKTLYLSSGEQYRVTETNDQPIINQKKLNTFIFKKDYANNEYHIIWKSGVVETLFGEEHFSSTKFLKKITSSHGSIMTISWEFIGQQARLKEINDSVNRLCDIKYNDNVSYEINLFPGEDEEQKVVVYFSNNYVTSIHTLGKEQSFVWFLNYIRIDDFYILNALSHPTGLIEKVDYKSSIMNFPSGANLRPLPAVTKFTVTPGFGQDEIITTYDYSSSNYLGYGTYNQWSAEKDYLFGVFDDYIYWVKEQNHIDGKIDNETTFNYNRFHLLTKQEYLKGSAKVTQDFTYYAKDNVLFEDQPPQYQLLRKHRTIYTANNQTRTTLTSYEFDVHGNPLLVIYNDGSTVEYEYYDPSIDTEAPVDSYGFIKYIKKQISTPVVTKFVTPIITELNNYVSVERHTPLGSFKVILLNEKEIYHDQQLTSKEVHQYDLNELYFGRHVSILHLLYLAPLFNEKKYIKKYHFEIVGNKLTQYTTVTTFDDIELNSKNITSLLSGQVYFEEDMHGNTVSWEYDSFKRIVSECYNKGTAYEQSTHYYYSSDEIGNITKVIDSLNNESRIHFDGLGRKFMVQNNSQENSNLKLVQVASFHYDGIGNIKSQHTIDHFFDSTKQSNNQTNLIVDFMYNDWGQDSETVIDNNFHIINEFNPLTNKSISYRRSFDSSKKSTSSMLDVTETTFNDSNLPILITRLDENLKIHSDIKREFDGAGRLRKEVNELYHILEWEYDISGRPIKQHLPDGTTVVREFADFTLNSLPISISVIGPEGNEYLLGKQEFDGLERLIMTSCGGRTFKFKYNDTSRQPHNVILPNGQMIDYQYIPELGNSISEINTSDALNSYEYYNENGLLRSASNDTTTMIYNYYNSGFLRDEKTIFNKDDSRFNTSFNWSSQGVLSEYQDSFDKKRNYIFQDNGFIETVKDSSITASFARDQFGRVIKVSVYDEEKCCVTTLGYNEFNQEIFREITFNDSDAYTIQNYYNLNGQLSQTDTHHNQLQLKSEHYYYDARNRLNNYLVSGAELPMDEYGNNIREQLIVWDTLNNHINCITTFDSGSNVASFFYENPSDPTQLTSIKNTHDSYPQILLLEYDLNGRLINDGVGGVMKYNNLGQLTNFSNKYEGECDYDYDAFGRLVTQTLSNEENRNLYYIGGLLCGEVQNTTGVSCARFINTEFGRIAIEEIKIS